MLLIECNRLFYLEDKKEIKLKEALELIGKENGFSNWKNYKDSLDTFWYSKSSPFLNQWFSNHKEAKHFQSESGGFLLTYKGQYFVALNDYIEYLGIDPHAEIWKIINYDVSSSNALEKFYDFYISTKGASNE